MSAPMKDADATIVLGVNFPEAYDVEVFEDAVPQKVSFFARSVDVPLTLGLIVDFSGSQDHFSKQHEEDLKVFLNEILGPKDRVFLICFEPPTTCQRLFVLGRRSSRAA